MPFIRIAGKAPNSSIYFDNENHFAYGIHTRYKYKKVMYLRCVYRNTKKCKARCIIKQRENTREWELQRVTNSHSHPPEPDYLEKNKIKKPEKEVILTGNEDIKLIFDEEGKKVTTVTPAKCKCNEMQSVISNKQKRILQSSHRSVDNSESSGEHRVTRNSFKISNSKVQMNLNSEKLKIKIRVKHGSSSEKFHLDRKKTKFSSKTARDPNSESKSTFEESSAATPLPTPDCNSQFEDVNSDLLAKDFSVEGTVKFLEVVAKDPNLTSKMNMPYQDSFPQCDSNQETSLVTEGDSSQISSLNAEKSSSPTSNSTMMQEWESSTLNSSDEAKMNQLKDGKIPEEKSESDSSAKQPTILQPFRSFRLISMNQNPSAAVGNKASLGTKERGNKAFNSSPPPSTLRPGCASVNQNPGMESASRMSYDLGDSGQNVASNIHGTFPGGARLLVPNPGFQFVILVPDTEGQTEIPSTQEISLNQCIPAIARSQGKNMVITLLRPGENLFQCDENGVSPMVIVPGTEAGKKAEALLEAQTPMDGGSNKHRLRLKRQWKLKRERRLKHRLKLKRQWKLERERRLKHRSSIEAQTPMETEAGKKAEASMEAQTPMETEAGKKAEASMEAQTPIETEELKEGIPASRETQVTKKTQVNTEIEATIPDSNHEQSRTTESIPMDCLAVESADFSPQGAEEISTSEESNNETQPSLENLESLPTPNSGDENGIFPHEEEPLPKNTSDNAKCSSTAPLQLTLDPSSQDSSFESVDDPPKKRARKQINWGERLKGSSILELRNSKKGPNTEKSQKTGLKRGRKRKNNLVSESERNPEVVKKRGRKRKNNLISESERNPVVVKKRGRKRENNLVSESERKPEVLKKRGRKRKNNLVSESERNPEVVKENESKEYVIDKIIGYHRDEQKENWYLITWKGFPKTHKTWEQIENLTNCNYMLMKYFEYEKPTEEKMSEIAKEIDDSLDNYTMYQKLIDSNFQKKYLDEFSKTCLDLSPLFTGDRVNSFLYKIETQYSYIIRTLIGMYDHRDWRMFQRGQNYNICIRICKRRMEQLKQLHKIGRYINRLESCFIKVENNVDLEHFPENVEYIPEMRLGKDVAVPEGSLIGCSCKNVCNENTDCCGIKLYHKSAYNENGLLILPEGSLIYECNSHCKCDKSCPNRVVQHGRKVKLAIFKTESSGWGVKVLEKVPKGTFICEYIGELIKDSEAVVREIAYVQEGFSYLFDLDFNPEIDDEKLHCIDSTVCGNVSRFLNHSCDPNLEVCPVWIDWLEPHLPRVAFFAKREINEGEEIRLQYSRNAEAASPGRYRNTPRIVSNQKCECGAANCRKWVF